MSHQPAGLPAGQPAMLRPGKGRKLCLHCNGIIGSACKKCTLPGCGLDQSQVEPTGPGMLPCLTGRAIHRAATHRRPIVTCSPLGMSMLPLKRLAPVLEPAASRAAPRVRHGAPVAVSEQHVEEQQQYSGATAGGDDGLGSGSDGAEGNGARSGGEGGSPEQRSCSPSEHFHIPFAWEEGQAEGLQAAEQHAEPQLHVEDGSFDEEDVQAYCRHMELSKQIWLVGSNPQGVECLAVPGFARTQSRSVSLMIKKPQHVVAIPVLFKGGTRRYVYICHACPLMETAIRSATGSSTASYEPEEWENVVQPCIHAAAVRRFHEEEAEPRLQALSTDVLLEHIESAVLGPDSDPVVLLSTPRLGLEHLLLSVSPPTSPGELPRAFVGANKQRELECLTCKHFRWNCKHVKQVAEAAAVAENWEEDAPTSQGAMEVADLLEGFVLRQKGQYVPAQVSAHLPRSGPVKLTPRAPGRMGRASAQFRGLLPPCASCVREGGAFSLCCHCVPEADGTCGDCGAPWSLEDPVAKGWKVGSKGVLLHVGGSAMDVDVYYRECSNRCCPVRRGYDGWSDGVFNYSDAVLMTHELGFSYTDDLVIRSLTLNAHYRTMQAAFNRSGPEKLPISLATHRRMQLAFMKRLDINYRERLTCPICEELEPRQQVIIADGTALGQLKQLFATYTPPTAVGAPVMPEQSKHTDRVSVPSKRARDLLSLWASKKGLKDGAWTELARILDCAEMHEIKRGVSFADEPQAIGEESDGHRCNVAYWPLFLDVARNFATCSFIPGSFAPHLREVCIRGRPLGVEDKTKLFGAFPSLAECAVNGKWTEVPEGLVPLLQYLSRRAEASQNCTLVPDHWFFDSQAESLHVYVPNHDLVRGLPPHVADKAKPDKGGECNKQHGTHVQLSPGIFLIFCGHGICIGFKLMPTCEGPSTLVDMIFTRWPEAPGTLIYDDCCHAFVTAHKRNPKYWSNTRFLIDRVHVKNHVACTSGFNLDRYDQDLELVKGLKLRDLNTQICEQTNNVLQRIATSLAFMTHENAFALVKYFVSEINVQKKAKM